MSQPATMGQETSGEVLKYRELNKPFYLGKKPVNSENGYL